MLVARDQSNKPGSRSAVVAYLFIATSLLLTACGAGKNDEAAAVEAAAVADIFERDRGRVLEQLATEVIPAGYQSLAEQAEVLKQSAQQFCDAPSDNLLVEVQDQWKATKSAHAYTEAMEFGEPVNALDGSGNQSRARRLYIRDVSQTQMIARINALIESTDIISETTIASANITVQGLQAIEYLLFANASGVDSSDFEGNSSADQRCAYLVAATQNIDSIADVIIHAWLPSGGNFAAELISAGEGSTVYADKETALDDVFSVLNSLIQTMRDAKLGEVIETADPADAESWRAQQSLNNYQNNLDGIYAVYKGGSGFGADDFYSVTIEEPIAEQNIQITFDDAQSGIAVVFEPFSIAVASEFGLIRMEILEGYVAALADNIEQRVFTAITGSSSDFNFNDGD